MRTLTFFLRRPLLLLSAAFLALVLLAACAPSLLSGDNPLLAVPAQRLSPPSLHHLFGTDELGRDLFSRVVYGAALSLQSAAIAVGIGLVVGTLAGLVAGSLGGWVDDAIMRLVDVLLAIPSLLLALALLTALGFGTVHVAIAVGLTGVAGFARLMRAESLRVRSATYVEAAHVVGTRWYTVLLRHILPNAIGPVLVLATLELGTFTLAVAALSFLGFGASPPTPEWGSLVAEGQDYLSSSWWMSTLPGLTVAITVLATNRLSRAFDREWRYGR